MHEAKLLGYSVMLRGDIPCKLLLAIFLPSFEVSESIRALRRVHTLVNELLVGGASIQIITWVSVLDPIAIHSGIRRPTFNGPYLISGGSEKYREGSTRVQIECGIDRKVGRVVYPDRYVGSILVWAGSFILIGMWNRSIRGFGLS